MRSTFIVPQEPVLEKRFLSANARQVPLAATSYAALRVETAFARNALFHGVAALGLAAGDRVLLPAYICAAAVLPLIARGLSCDFYPVREDCRVTTEDIEAALQPQTRAVLVVHYFGFPQSIEAIRALCDARRVMLIEDCAHVVAGSVAGRPLGSFGDMSVFSWRKFVPLREGATLLLNRPSAGGIAPLRSTGFMSSVKEFAALLETSAHRPGGSPHRMRAHVFALVGGIRGLARRPQHSKGDGSAGELESAGERFNATTADDALKGATTFLARHSDWGRITAQRRSNYERLVSLLSAFPRCVPLRAILPEEVCPWVLPLRIAGCTDAHLSLRRAGIPAVTWDGVRPKQVTAQEFPEADGLYRNLVFLPVHQSLTATELTAIAERVSAIARSGR